MMGLVWTSILIYLLLSFSAQDGNGREGSLAPVQTHRQPEALKVRSIIVAYDQLVN